jgi:hypothetical protein
MAFKHLTYAAIPLIAASMSVSLTTHAATIDQLNRQIQKLSQRMAAQDQRFRINGFASFGLTQSDQEMAYNDIDDDVSFSRFSKLGLQMSFNMDAQNSVVTQLVSRGENDWETHAEWAYFKHEFNNGFSTKIGRIRLPAYQLSEFLDVGYATPYAQIPAETYDSLAPFANMDGIDLGYSTDVGDNTLNLQLTYGHTKDDEFELSGVIDFSATFQADTWSTRVAYGEATLKIVSDDFKAAVGLYGGATDDIESTFTSVGFTYDPGDLYFTAEATQLAIGSQFVDADAMLATLGYRMGRLLPTITFATTESSDDTDRDISQITAENQGALQLASAVATAIGGGATEAQAITGVAAAQSLTDAQVTAAVAGAPLIVAGVNGLQAASNRNTQRIGLGLKYDMSPGTALNLQYDIITVDDESGLFDDTAWATNAATGGTNPDSSNILTITIDTVF